MNYDQQINPELRPRIIIDPKAGFCGGVKRAIKMVQKEFECGREVFVRGELIHNQREMERLYGLGLKVWHELESVPCQTLFIRTHGEAPEIYEKAKKSGIEVIDATCRNVRRSQEIISSQAALGRKIYIFGKKHHPEVIGLLGYCRGNGVVFQSEADVENIVEDTPALLIPQTTADPVKFEVVRRKMGELISDLKVYNAICPFVSQREQELMVFARSYDAVVFVGGKHSSNTAVLFTVCQQANPNAFFAEKPAELPLDKLSGFSSIGISGSASTPMWQLKEIAQAIKEHIVKSHIKNLKPEMSLEHRNT